MGSLFNNLDGTAANLLSPTVEIKGVLDHVTFHNDDNGYTVARLVVEGRREPVTITGVFSRPTLGETYLCRGVWKTHLQFGKQLEVRSYEVVRPVSREDIERYLGSGMVKGVGPVTAKRIVHYFGERSLDVIETAPNDLLKIPGIGAKTVGIIKGAWGESRGAGNCV